MGDESTRVTASGDCIMRKLPLAEQIVDVLAKCSDDPRNWPAGLRSDCAWIHARYQALKLDVSTAEAWKQAKLEWVRNVVKRSGIVQVAYHFRECAQPGL
jgi:hypothetical protein